MTARTARYAALPQSRPCAFCAGRIRRGEPATYLVLRLSDVPRVEVYHYVHEACPIPLVAATDSAAPDGTLTTTFFLRLLPSDTTTDAIRADLAFDRIAHLVRN